MNQLVTIVDTETSGFDPGSDHLLEVGAVLFDLRSGVPIQTYASLVQGAPTVGPPEVRQIHGIPPTALPHGLPREDVVGTVQGMAACSRYVLAHNAPFDKKWLPELDSSTWICTWKDVVWPFRAKTRNNKLGDIAGHYGVGIARAHRAIEDCLTLSDILHRLHVRGVDLVEMLDYAAAPHVDVAVGSTEPHMASSMKDEGFHWDRSARLWRGRVRADALDALRGRLPAGVHIAAT